MKHQTWLTMRFVPVATNLFIPIFSIQKEDLKVDVTDDVLNAISPS